MTGTEITKALNEAVQLRSKGDPEGALGSYRRVLDSDPDNLQAHCSSGEILLSMGRKTEAIVHFREGLRIDPGLGLLYSNLASALKSEGKLKEALEAMSKAVKLVPGHAGIRVNHGNSLLEAGLLDAAVKEYEQALRLSPDMAKAHYGLGSTQLKLGNPEEAEKCYREALRIDPDYADALTNLGVVLRERLQLDEALELSQRAVALEPQNAAHRHSKAFTLQHLNRWDEAVAEWQRALELKPDHANAHLGIATTHLLHGRLGQGWPEYEWRWHCRGAVMHPLLKQHRNQLWDGSSLEGKTILLYVEQGLGDAIQFIRFVPTLVKMARRVLVACHHDRLNDLLQSVEGVDDIIGVGQAIPQFDFHCPLMSLPRLLKIDDCEKIPPQAPYVQPQAKLVDLLRDELGDRDPGTLRVGINWQGSVGYYHDNLRSTPLRIWSVLKDVPGVQWISLQYEATANDLSAEGVALPIENLGGRLAELASGKEPQMNMNLTAAALMNLDLVITVDTMLAHMAGALGRPAWVLLPNLPDWRWMLERSDSPWYPSLRLFRQQSAGNWGEVMTEVKSALSEMTAAE